jgi:hypothetical protein
VWTMRKSRCTSCAEREAVGSSMISTRTSSEIALAISTVCCSARVRPRAGSPTSSRTSSRARTSRASRSMRRRSTILPRSRWPMKMFSATDRSGKIIGS